MVNYYKGYMNGFHNVQLYEQYSTHLYNHLNIIISIKDGVEVFILLHYISPIPKTLCVPPTPQ